ILPSHSGDNQHDKSRDSQAKGRSVRLAEDAGACKTIALGKKWTRLFPRHRGEWPWCRARLEDRRPVRDIRESERTLEPAQLKKRERNPEGPYATPRVALHVVRRMSLWIASSRSHG